ncbi:hypothetical protein Ate01nite_64950 [Actinoplanes teichomyceticus]|nr:hypothetical protein Ate01nite_64950 [Actinoplanes teichomyceticus]
MDPDGALAEAPGQRLPEPWPADAEQLAGAVREGLADSVGQFERRMLLMSSATPIAAEFVSPSFSATPVGLVTESFERLRPVKGSDVPRSYIGDTRQWIKTIGERVGAGELALRWTLSGLPLGVPGLLERRTLALLLRRRIRRGRRVRRRRQSRAANRCWGSAPAWAAGHDARRSHR